MYSMYSMYRMILVVLSFILSASVLMAQQSLNTGLFDRELLEDKQLKPETIKRDAVPLEGPVDRDSYIVGPGDVLTVGIWSEEEQIIPLPVTPEGYIIVPSVGLIAVAGKTLAEAESQMIESLRDFYRVDRVTLSLTGIRNIKVFVSGQVEVQGSQTATAVDRVYDAIFLGGGFRESGSRRSICLTRKNGTERSLDLVRFLVYGDLDENPVLMDGDRVHVPSRQGYVRVRGEVGGLRRVEVREKKQLREGELPFPKEGLAIEFIEGDRLSDIIEIAGGFAESADISHVVIRKSGISTADSVVTLDLRDFFFKGDTTRDIFLENGDIIDVPVQRDMVYVTGAVTDPGWYPYESSFVARDYVGLAGGPAEYGASGRWKVVGISGKKRDFDADEPLHPGDTIVVPERIVRRLGNLLLPLTAISTVIIAIAALQR